MLLPRASRQHHGFRNAARMGASARIEFRAVPFGKGHHPGAEPAHALRDDLTALYKFRWQPAEITQDQTD